MGDPRATAFNPAAQFQRMLYERTSGRLQLKIVARMFPTAELLEPLMQGKADIARYPIAYATGTYPYFGWGDYPGIYKSYDPNEGPPEEIAIYRDPTMRKLHDDAFRKIGLVYLGNMVGSGGQRLLWSNTKAEKLADIKGLKVRFAGAMNVKAWSALGGTAVSLPFSEIPGALMTGTLDGAIQSIEYGYLSGFHKITKYATEIPLATWFPEMLLVNASAFDKLPPDLQQALRDTGRELEDMVAYAQTIYILAAKNAVQSSGIQMLKLQDTDKALQTLQEVWKAEWIPQAGPTGQQMLDAANQAVQKYRAFKAP